MAKTQTPYQAEDHSLTSSDGESSLFVKHYVRGTPRTHFLVVHGALEHSGRHRDLVQFWLANIPDVAVTVFDHLGHGKSGGPRAYLTHFKNYVEDMLIVANFAYGKLPEGCKKFICAHSLGGLITLSRFLDSTFGWHHSCDGVMFSSPCVKPRLLLGPSSEPILLKMDKLTPRLHLPMIFKGSQLTRDTQRANDFDTDPLIPRFITVRMMKEILDATHRIRGLSYYVNFPTLFLIAGDDILVQPDSTTLFAHGIDKKLVQVIQYPQHHHELWNEIDRFEIFATMKKWVEKILKERP